MKRAIIAGMTLLAALTMTACATTKVEQPTENKTTEVQEETASEETESEEVVSEETDGKITDEQALSAIKNYCLSTNPELEDMVDSDDATIYWEIESSDENQIVVLYRSYTAALVRYYIDTASGETYVTEYVEGITPEEEQTDESFNVKDYIENDN